MHICGMDFSSLASYWQIKALLMLEPSVVTPQNQYFPANSERMSVHCLESGCIEKYTHLGPRDFPRVGILHPSALEIALGLRPRAISRASGCKIPALGKSLGPRGVYFPIHPSSRQCTDTIFKQAAQIWISLIPDTQNTHWFWKQIECGSGIEKYFKFGSGIGADLSCLYTVQCTGSKPSLGFCMWCVYFLVWMLVDFVFVI